jgi:MFS family permease
VIPIENERCCGCCSLPKPLNRRLNHFLAPWREFFYYQSNWSWVILVASFLTYSIGEALTSVFPILFVALQEEFPDQGSSRIALVQSMMNSVPCLAGPIASIATTRFGYRKTAMMGGTITSISLLATSFARRLEFLYITMGICYAFGNSLVLVATVVAVTEHFEAKPSFASGVTISGM